MSDSATPTSDQTLRFVNLVQIGEGRYKAINRRGGVLPIGSGDDPDFSPVELLLAAIAGCSVLDVAHVTRQAGPGDGRPGADRGSQDPGRAGQPARRPAGELRPHLPGRGGW